MQNKGRMNYIDEKSEERSEIPKKQNRILSCRGKLRQKWKTERSFSEFYVGFV